MTGLVLPGRRSPFIEVPGSFQLQYLFISLSTTAPRPRGRFAKPGVSQWFREIVQLPK